MKNLFLTAAVVVMLTACSNSSSKSTENKSAAQRNLDAAHAITKAFENGDTSLIDSVVADDFVDHRQYGDVKGRDSLKLLVRSVHEHVENLKIKTIKELADGDYVMSWKDFSGKGDGQGNTRQGAFDVSGVQMTQFKNGKAVEHWEALDIQDVYKIIQRLNPTGVNE